MCMANCERLQHMTKLDWQAWHRPYDDPDSPLSRRLHVVQELVRAVLDQAAPGSITAISICAGEGRDLLGVLADHPRSADVAARRFAGSHLPFTPDIKLFTFLER